MKPKADQTRADSANLTRTVRVSRSYKTSIEAAFDAWTKPLSLEKWLGPPGFRAEVLMYDLRVGGRLGNGGTGGLEKDAVDRDTALLVQAVAHRRGVNRDQPLLHGLHFDDRELHIDPVFLLTADAVSPVDIEGDIDVALAARQLRSQIALIPIGIALLGRVGHGDEVEITSATGLVLATSSP